MSYVWHLAESLTAPVPDAQLTVVEHVVSQARLDAFGEGGALLGYAVLKRNGTRYVCNVYLTVEADHRTREHELQHCHGWSHQ